MDNFTKIVDDLPKRNERYLNSNFADRSSSMLDCILGHREISRIEGYIEKGYIQGAPSKNKKRYLTCKFGTSKGAHYPCAL